MSDRDDFAESEEESGDFSVSEDEWNPEEDEETTEESSDDEEDDTANTADSEEEGPSIRSKRENIKKTKGRTMKKISKNPKLGRNSRSQTSSLRSRLVRRFNPPPKSTGSPVPVKVANILSNLQYVKRKQMAPSQSSQPIAEQKPENNNENFESESSSDEGFVRPGNIDFDLNTFKTPSTAAPVTSSEAPLFDCNAGMNLSDSSDSDDDDDDDGENDFVEASTSNMTETKGRNILIDKINQKSSGEVHDFSNLQEFAKKLESAKAHLQQMKDKEANTVKIGGATGESDVAKLLSMGEQKSVATAADAGSRKRKHKDERPSDDSDWENVSDDNEHNTTDDIKDIQITVGGSTIRDMSRDKKKVIDLEACLKRRLNREIKENQIFLHKASTLGWIGHGNYMNRILNDMTLMEMCLKLLPSKNAYPDGDTDIQYFKAITAWFHELFKLKSTNLYCDLKGIQSKIMSLQLQLRSKQVICKCDYILLFVSMLRSIGIQCRLVINLAVLPLRPPQKDLFVVSTKPTDEIELSNKSKKSGKSVTLAKKLKVSASQMKTSFVEKEAEKPKKRIESNSRDNSLKSNHSSPGKPSTSGRAVGAVVSKLRLVKQDKVRNTGSPVPMSQIRNEKVNLDTKPEPMASRRRHKETANTNGPSTCSRSKPSSLSKLKSSSSSQIKDHAYSSPKSSRSREPSASPSKSLRMQPSTSSSASSFSLRSKQPSASTSKLTSIKNDNPSASTSKTNGETSTKAKVEKSSNESSVPSEPTVASRVPKQSGDNVPMFSPRKTRRQAAKLNLKLPQLDGAGKIPKKGTKRTNAKDQKQVDESDESSDDSDFEPSPPKRVRSKLPTKTVVKRRKSANNPNTSRKLDRRVFTDEEDPEQEVPNTERMDFWVEAYAEKEKKWIVIDPVKKKVDCVDHVRKSATKPIIYAFAWNNDNTLRDVTPRYCSQFHTSIRKLRAEQLWIDDAIRSFVEQRNNRTIIEDVEFSKLHMNTPMPTSINEYKNHPLYALERHLLKFEAIYPSNALTLGYCRNEPVFARECVHTLHSREIWVKQARTVKVGEKPYKIVKARPKWNRLLNQMEDPKPLEIFGHWQTEQYKPPVAENGIVPRNAYGNVELFKPEMLPIGTRHLQLPNLNRVCKKMNVDCAQAVIGFDFHGGSSHPTFDGFVVCEEFADDVIKQWEIEQEEQIRKEIEKREARVYGNWKKLIKGLLIRERLKRKFNFGLEPTKPEKGKKKK